MGFLEADNLVKRYRGEQAACVDGFHLSVGRGEICVLLGASGCGKSTVLKLVAGLEEADAGTVTIDGERMDGIAPEKRPVAMVFQKALLFRNMTVEQNVNFAPRVNRSLPKAELARRTNQMLELVGLKGLGKKRATALSGGQEQRVSLARALMVAPKLLLLDEPLSALDASLREGMQGQIRQLNRETGVTMVLVTHDQQEAIALADRVAVMHGGRIVQIDEPRVFYERPCTEYVASFFGWKNFVAATCTGSRVRCALGDFDLTGIPEAQGSGFLVVRPESAAMRTGGRLSAQVVDVSYRGMDVLCEVECAGQRLKLAVPAAEAPSRGDTVSFDLDPALLWFVSDDHDRAYAEEGAA